MTDNVIDLAPLHSQILAEGSHHSGIVFCKMPRSKSTIGAWVRSLESLLTVLGPTTDLDDTAQWVPGPS